MLDNPVFVGLVLPIIPAVIVLVLVTRTFRREFGPRVLIAISSICSIATYVAIVIILQRLGVQP